MTQMSEERAAQAAMAQDAEHEQELDRERTEQIRLMLVEQDTEAVERRFGPEVTASKEFEAAQKEQQARDGFRKDQLERIRQEEADRQKAEQREAAQTAQLDQDQAEQKVDAQEQQAAVQPDEAVSQGQSETDQKQPEKTEMQQRLEAARAEQKKANEQIRERERQQSQYEGMSM